MTIYHPFHLTEGMQQLYQEIVLMALRDALHAKRKVERAQADAWIRSGGNWFRQCCTYAGWDPDFVRDAYVSGRVNPDLFYGQYQHDRRRASCRA